MIVGSGIEGVEEDIGGVVEGIEVDVSRELEVSEQEETISNEKGKKSKLFFMGEDPLSIYKNYK